MNLYIARYGAMRLLSVFSFESEGDEKFSLATRVIVNTSRGMETAVILCDATDDAVNLLEPGFEKGRIIRAMTKDDIAEHRRIRANERSEFDRCQSIIDRMKIEMNLVRIEHLFGGERIIVYYVAEGRVDFRELVKVLASEFQTRIEMRQIGVRDETKLLADYGDCGREVCCNSYLVEMPPVSMKMAKLQKATLDPTKISGRCGRLKCCLRYEYDVYNEMQNSLPQIGKQVNTQNGPGKVVAQDIMLQKVWVDFPDQPRKLISIESLKPTEDDT